MARGWQIATAALVFACAASGAAVPASAQQTQPAGCLAAGNCGTKGTAPGARRDYWYNWMCSGCHTGPPAPIPPSPQEMALIQIPFRFWTMHAEAERNGETRMRARGHGLKPANALAPAFRNLMQNRPAKQ